MFDYFKVGQTLTDEFWYRSQSTFLGVTGKVQANFTIKLSKNGVGNQSTTGITITEVDSTNNPGLYSISASGTTGFPTNTGEYTLTIYDTASPQYAWETTYVVTADGTGAGTLGAGFFQSATGNGRITDGTSGLTGATVWLKNPSGVLVSSLTTDSSGNWSAYFNVNGTWSGIGYLAGYTQVSFSIIVSGATVTGPGTDVALTAVTSSSTITLGSLMSYGRRMVKDAIGTKADTDLKSSINDALLMLARERHWPWYERQSSITLNAPFGPASAGTLTFTQGSATVTISGDTFPSTITSDWQIKVTGQWARIASRTNGTTLQLAVAWGDVTQTIAAGAWTIFQDEYALPTDCARFGRLYPGSGWVWGGVPSSYEAVLNAKNAYAFQQKFPEAWAIHRDRLVMWPYPSQSINVQIHYLGLPAYLVNTTDSADWDPNQLEVLQRAIDYQLALRWGQTVSGDPSATYSRYESALARAANNDRSPLRPGNPLGNWDRMKYPQPRLLS